MSRPGTTHRLATGTIALLLGAGCAPGIEDRVELRRGETLDGRVEGYAGDVLTFETARQVRTYARPEIEAITLGIDRPGPEEIPSAGGDPHRDRIVLRSGEQRRSRLEAIDDRSVVTRAERFDRAEVFRIELAREPGGGRAADDGGDEEEEPEAYCWRGSIHVRDRYRRPATAEQITSRRCPSSLETWQGAAEVLIEEEHAVDLDDQGMQSDTVFLRYREIVCKLTTPGWERVCSVPETYGPQALQRHRYQLGFRIAPAAHLDRVDGDDARVQGAGFYALDLPEGTRVRRDAERLGLQPGQYLLEFPNCGSFPGGFPLVAEKWHTAIEDRQPKWPTIRTHLGPLFCRPWHSAGFSPGNTREINHMGCTSEDATCFDEARFVGDGWVMKGETYCRREYSGGQIQIYQAVWELERTDDCDTPLPRPEEFEWPPDPGVEVEETTPEGVIVPRLG